jgi:hypothetical protein
MTNILTQSRGLSMGSADGSILHSCGNSHVQRAILDMCRMENMLVCVRLSFLSCTLALPLQQLKSFLITSTKASEDPFVWLARDVTITRVQTSLPSIFCMWKGIVAAASAAKTVCCLWRQQWRLLWQKSGMNTQLHGIAGTQSSDVDMEAACGFEKKYLHWAQASCRSLWQPAVSYGCCLKLVELGLESVCCMMEAPILQKTVYSRIGGERFLDVVGPHRRHLKILQLWMQVREGQQTVSAFVQPFAGNI